ncbi:hypothetical protein K2P97_12925 [bacterium]|nr:hypothetical protein [bacterium]
MLKSCFVLFTTIFIFSLPALTADQKSFDGVWQTTYGRMRLVNLKADQIEGVYAYQTLSQIKGSVNKNKITFTYTETNAKGEGWFVLADDGLSFEGEWRQSGLDKWTKWSGKKITASPGINWLIVLEAGWENSLEQKEMSFGDMLKTFFAHNQYVSVRHRYFSDEKTFIRWLNEVIFIPEPVVVTVAAHGMPDGVPVNERTIGAKTIANNLAYATSVKLLHFSSCLIMKENFGKEIIKNLNSKTKFPVSGYKTTVDWIASAVFEFMYFDLILNRDLDVKSASSTVTKLMPFGDSKQISGSPFKSMDFDILLPSVR